MKCLSRSHMAIIIGCLNILTYCLVGIMVFENVKYDRYSHYDYDDYRDVYKSYELREETRAYRELYCMIYVIVCVIMMLLSGLLIWGVVKQRPGLMVPWLLGSFIVVIYSSTEILDDIFLKSSFQSVANATIFFSVLFFVFGFQMLCLALVYSVFRNFEVKIILQRFCDQHGEVFDDYKTGELASNFKKTKAEKILKKTN
uniref:Uncharacterized protein n=1 Tax=Stomoxys calcitrans TaxID=35570 RepID=A0A1I8QEL2_STOCA